MATHVIGTDDRYRPLNEFDIYDRNDEPDETAMRFAAATEVEKELLEQLCCLPALP
jgi:hypothetical protein